MCSVELSNLKWISNKIAPNSELSIKKSGSVRSNGSDQLKIFSIFNNR